MVAQRFRELSFGLDECVDAAALAHKVCGGLAQSTSADQLTELMAETAAYQTSLHPDFARLAARLNFYDKFHENLTRACPAGRIAQRPRRGESL